MFISMKIINFINRFFLEILQRHCIIILSILGINGHTCQKLFQFIENCDAHLQKKPTSPLTSSLKYCKDFANLLFWVIWASMAISNKINGINLWDCLMFICMQKNQLHPSFHFWDIAKILQTFYFGYFVHAWLRPVKTILPACRKLPCLSSCIKVIFISHFFLEILKKYCKLIILGTSTIPGCIHQKQ